MAQSSEEPPFLTVGTDVSAKYRGAFCEASVKVVKKHVKCKITFAKTNTSFTVNDDCVKGSLKVGAVVEAKTPDGVMEGVITKLTDASVYTVVFDDGDERTLRRTSLCLKGERHFNESETLDHLPLTDPENFGTPVVQDGKKRKKRRLSQATSLDDSETERDEQSGTTPAPSKKKCLFDDSIVGKVVVVESGSKRRNMWFPALGVNPSKNEVDLIKSKDKCLVRSFKDGKYHVINVKDTKEFAKDQDPVKGVLKGENRKLKAAVERAITYQGTGRIPGIWEENASDVIVNEDSEEDSKRLQSSEDEGSVEEDDEKKAFKEKLYTFMKEKGTPISRPPVLGNQDLDLHRLYKIVQEHGGMEKVSIEQSLWRKIYQQMDIPVVPPSASHHIKMAYKKYLYPFELHEKETLKPSVKEEVSERSSRDKKIKPESPDSPPDSSDEKHLECLEPSLDIDEDHEEVIVKKQSTRIKEMKRQQSRDLENSMLSESQTKSPEEDVSVDVVNSPESSSDVSEPQSDSKSDIPVDENTFEIGDKIQVKYGRGRNHRLYDAKIIHIDSEASEGTLYCIHYAGWNNRYDEWIKPEKIAGWGTRQTRNRTGGVGKVQDSKATPKPVTRPTAKPAGRRSSKAAAVTPAPVKEVNTKQSPASNITKNSSKRPCSPSTRSGSLSPSLGKSSKTSSGRGTGRTRSERNSVTETSNGLDEVKSPLSRRRQKSATPEPSSLEQPHKPVDIVNHIQPIPKAIPEETDKKTAEEKSNLVPSSNIEENHNSPAPCENGVLCEVPDVELKSEQSSNDSSGKRKDKHKRVVNGLVRSLRSPETVVKDSEDTKGFCPEPKKIKLELESTMQDTEVAQIMSDGTSISTPSQPPQTKGTPTAVETVSNSSEEMKPSVVNDALASSSGQCSDHEEKGNTPVENSSVDSNVKSSEHDKKEKDSKMEKKNCEHHHRKQKKRKEKKKHRHASGNDSTGSDAPGSPMYNQPSGVFPSPRRPRISFDMDLEEIKTKEDGCERIKLLQDKINEMRKVYSNLKAEVASIDRKRKKLKKKREAAESIEGQDVHKSLQSSSSSSSSSSSHAVPSPSVPPVECR